MGFGATLQKLREAAGLSQAELASRAGLKVDSIQNWEQERTRPRLEFLPRIAQVLGVSLDALIAPDQQETKEKRRGRPPKRTPAPKPPAKKRRKEK